MSIGEVLAQLREDFPDVTISKLRFLEAEGLVEPQRTSAGYRKYTRADVARLGFVLAAQRDRFLPLRIIREHLAALDRGEPAAVASHELLSTGTRTSGVPTPRRPTLASVGDTHDLDRDRYDAGGDPRLTRDELLDRSGLASAVLAELEDGGLICGRSPGWYDGDALAIARLAAGLAEYGLAPRHLRAYRAAADREVGLFMQLVTPLARASTPAAQARAAEVVREMAALSQQLHAALVRVGLRTALGQ